METPIVSYTQTLFKGTVTFRLFPDRLLMNGKVTFKSDYETSIPLASLDPEFATLNIRPRVFMFYVQFALFAFLACEMLVRHYHQQWTDHLPGLLLMLGVSFLIAAAATYQKVHFVCFKNRTGRYALYVARAGKETGQFDSFIATLVKQIKTASEAS